MNRLLAVIPDNKVDGYVAAVKAAKAFDFKIQCVDCRFFDTKNPLNFEYGKEPVNFVVVFNFDNLAICYQNLIISSILSNSKMNAIIITEMAIGQRFPGFRIMDSLL